MITGAYIRQCPTQYVVVSFKEKAGGPNTFEVTQAKAMNSGFHRLEYGTTVLTKTSRPPLVHYQPAVNVQLIPIVSGYSELDRTMPLDNHIHEGFELNIV